MASVVFVPKTRHVVSGGRDNTARLWDIDTGKELSCIRVGDWVGSTSVNAVDVVFDAFAPLLLQEDRCVKFAAIGPKTAEGLKARGIVPDFVPEEYVAEAILPGLGDLLGKWVLLPRAEIARKALPEAIFNAGGVPHEITVYKTLPTQPNLEGLLALHEGVDVITFTSQSTVMNFIAIAEKNGLDPRNLPNDPVFACIGPITGQAAKEAGLSDIVIAKEYTTDGLLAALKNLEVS